MSNNNTTTSTPSTKSTENENAIIDNDEYYNEPISLNQRNSYTILTRTEKFQDLVKWSFDKCDHKKNGKLGKEDLYMGVILVHLELAKYFGTAACYPPSVTIIEQLFDAADSNNSNYIDEEEFRQILVICCGQITSRIFVYYTVIILFVPYIAKKLIISAINIDEVLHIKGLRIDMINRFFIKIERFLTFGKIAESLLSMILFTVVVPKLFDYIDSYSNRSVKRRSGNVVNTKKDN